MNGARVGLFAIRQRGSGRTGARALGLLYEEDSQTLDLHDGHTIKKDTSEVICIGVSGITGFIVGKTNGVYES